MEKENTIRLHEEAVEGIKNYFSSQGFSVKVYDKDKLSYKWKEENYSSLYDAAINCNTLEEFYSKIEDFWSIQRFESKFAHAKKLSKEEFIKKEISTDVKLKNLKSGDIIINHPSMICSDEIKVVGGTFLSSKTFNFYRGNYVAFYNFENPELSKIARSKSINSYFQTIKRCTHASNIIRSFEKFENFCYAKDFVMFCMQMYLLNAECIPNVKTDLIKAYFIKRLPRGKN